jgi:hypothetical protein
VAKAFAWALREVDADQLAHRAGGFVGGGMCIVNEAATILEELLQPELDDMVRRAALGLDDSVRLIALGLLRGLANCRGGAENGSVLAHAGPDVTDDLALSRDTLTKAGIDLPDDPLEELSSEPSER